jgi:hypothetical protein
MARREALMVESGDAAVALREERAARQGQGNAIPAYLEHLFLAIAQYSRGDDLTEVRKGVRKAVEVLEQDSSHPKQRFDFGDPDQFYGALWGLSLSMVFGDPSAEFVHRGAGQDAVYDRLLKLTGALVAPTAHLVRPQPYQSLVAAMEDASTAGSLIDEYLKTWYAGMGGTSWHETHLQHDPYFFGYWAFELAAVVKALNITDKPFVDNLFYPRDLVHQRLFRTWLDSPEGEHARMAKAVLEAQQQFEVAKDLLVNFFNGSGSEADAQSMDDSLKSLSGLMGLRPEAIQDNPELLRLGMLQLFRIVANVSKDALRIAGGNDEAGKAKISASIQELEAKLKKEIPDLAALSKAFEQEAEQAGQIEGGAAKIAENSKSRLEMVQAAMDSLVKDETIELEEIFTQLERLSDQYGEQLGISKPEERDITKEVSERVSKELGEANKKNMIGPDFDWSSIWKKS